MSMFNGKRLALARKRSKYTGKRLAEIAGITPVTLSKIERNIHKAPEAETIDKLAKALGYPKDFFYLDDADELTAEAASFRSFTKLTARDRDAALAAGYIAFEISDWVSERFNLPEPDIIDLSSENNPELAAKSLRIYWGLGEAPIPNLINLLEAKGVRVFSLSENTKSVDAFSCWRNETPYIFLNTFKTAERSRFDAAHELGHLVMHQHGGPNELRSIKEQHDPRATEKEADQFASAFLMPKDDLKARLPFIKSIDTLIKAKERWRVSAMALAYRMHELSLLTDWQYRSACIELDRRGYRNNEPDGIEREYSTVWQKVFEQLWAERKTRDNIANDLYLPVKEIDALVFGLIGNALPKNRSQTSKKSSKLRVVHG
ncbi:MAG: XRE family transcriptional regulator [Pseudomonadota bacterium]